MKKLLALLMTVAMLFAFAGCGDKDDKKDTFKCDVCDKEQSGEKHELETGDETFTLCDDCYKEIDGGYADDFDYEEDDNDDYDNAANEDTFECYLCEEEITGKVYEAEGVEFCKDCYEEYLEYTEDTDIADTDDECIGCGEALDSDEGYKVVDEEMEGVMCDDCFEMIEESAVEEGYIMEGGFVFDEDGTVVGEYEKR